MAPLVGQLATSTNSTLSTASPVLKPRGGVPRKNSEVWLFGATLTIVVPVPWTFALSLKLETRMSPGLSYPLPGKPGGTNATP